MRRRGSTPLPPGPRLPAAVNLAQLAARPLPTLLGWHARYGDYITVPLPVIGTGVYVADPAAVRALFTGDQSDLLAGEANSFMEPVLGPSSVLILDGAEHMRHRKLLLPPFQGAPVSDARASVRELTEREVAGWHPGRRLVLRERMRAVTFEVICRAVFGVAEPARVARLRAALIAVVDSSPLFMLSPLVRRDFGTWSPGHRFVQRRRAADALIHDEIARRRNVPDLDERRDVLSLLLRARDEAGVPLSAGELRDELFTMLAAGYETTATGLAFAFDLLVHHPPVLARLRDELSGGGGDPYLDAVVKETLRIRPVIDAPERTLTQPRRLGPWEVPAGVKVYPAIVPIHMRPDLYPDPHTFRPERFLDARTDAYTWLPFGGGIRRCIGAALAQAEMAEVLRVVVPRVELEPVRPELDRVVLRGITLAPRHGVEVRVRRISGRMPAGAPPAAGADRSQRVAPAV
jgi:cytochrome P450